jgi:hypothetical protein
MAITQYADQGANGAGLSKAETGQIGERPGSYFVNVGPTTLTTSEK